LKTLVLGIGNLLLGDEGVGVHAAHALMASDCPEGVTVLEVGTAILDALPALETADRVIILDAIKADGTPGSIYRIPLNGCQQKTSIASMHGFDIFSVIALTGRKEKLDGVILGVEPSYMGWSMELSPQVKAALPALLDAVRSEVGSSAAYTLHPLLMGR